MSNKGILANSFQQFIKTNLFIILNSISYMISVATRNRISSLKIINSDWTKSIASETQMLEMKSIFAPCTLRNPSNK